MSRSHLEAIRAFSDPTVILAYIDSLNQTLPGRRYAPQLHELRPLIESAVAFWFELQFADPGPRPPHRLADALALLTVRSYHAYQDNGDLACSILTNFLSSLGYDAKAPPRTIEAIFQRWSSGTEHPSYWWIRSLILNAYASVWMAA